jgi:glycine dehydrogenase subunit 1
MTLLGGHGLARMARASHAMARRTAARLSAVPDVELVNRTFFNEFAVRLPRDARETVRGLADRRVLGGVSLGRLYPGRDNLANGLLVAASEMTTDEDIAALGSALEETLA